MMAAIWAFILFALPSLLKFIFTFLGIGVISFVALDFVVTNVSTIVFANYNNIATDALAILQIANVDTAINIVLSSYTAGIAVKTLLNSNRRFKLAE